MSSQKQNNIGSPPNEKFADDLVVKYVEGCVVVTASAKLLGEEAKVYDVAMHNICSEVDI
jgi:hypothetical protein